MQITQTYTNGSRSAYRVIWKGRTKIAQVNAGNPRQERCAALMGARKAINKDLAEVKRRQDQRESRPMLEELDRANVVSFHLDGKYIVVGECCDYYYEYRLTKQEAQQLISELQSLTDKLD